MKSSKELFSSFFQKFVLVFLLIELSLIFLAKKDFFYLFVKELVKSLSLNSYFGGKFFWDTMALVITLCLFFIALALRVFILLIRDYIYELHSKAAFEKAKANINTTAIIMMGDKK